MNRPDRIAELKEVIQNLEDAQCLLLDDTGPIFALPPKYRELIWGDLVSCAEALEAEQDELQEELFALEEAEEADPTPEPVPEVECIYPQPAPTKLDHGKFVRGEPQNYWTDVNGVDRMVVISRTENGRFRARLDGVSSTGNVLEKVVRALGAKLVIRG